jgi:hypothetical protein
MNVMPRDITHHTAILIHDDESAGLVKTCWTDDGTRGPRTEVIKRTLTAGQQREILWALRPQDDRHAHNS